jgi:toxin ParE1/3/4
MRVRWTTTAADDLAHIVITSAKIIPLPPAGWAQTIFQAIAGLRKFPNRGRIGVAENTRELILSQWPYIAVYEIIGDQVEVLRIRHAVQDWP